MTREPYKRCTSFWNVRTIFRKDVNWFHKKPQLTSSYSVRCSSIFSLPRLMQWQKLLSLKCCQGNQPLQWLPAVLVSKVARKGRRSTSLIFSGVHGYLEGSRVTLTFLCVSQQLIRHNIILDRLWLLNFLMRHGYGNITEKYRWSIKSSVNLCV